MWHFILYDPNGSPHVTGLVYANWGDAEQKLGNFENAIDKYRASAFWRGKFDQAYNEWSKNENVGSDDVKKLTNEYENQINQSPQDPDGYFDMSKLLWSRGNREEASRYLLKGINLPEGRPITQWC
jgi:tetratricopeptide (TPR) repeat protein